MEQEEEDLSKSYLKSLKQCSLSTTLNLNYTSKVTIKAIPYNSIEWGCIFLLVDYYDYGSWILQTINGASYHYKVAGEDHQFSLLNYHGTECVIEITFKKLSVNGVTIATISDSTTPSFNNKQYNCFAPNWRYNELKLETNGEPVFDYVPIKVGNQYGMHELVTDTILGLGNFTLE